MAKEVALTRRLVELSGLSPAEFGMVYGTVVAPDGTSFECWSYPGPFGPRPMTDGMREETDEEFRTRIVAFLKGRIDPRDVGR